MVIGFTSMSATCTRTVDCTRQTSCSSSDCRLSLHFIQSSQYLATVPGLLANQRCLAWPHHLEWFPNQILWVTDRCSSICMTIYVCSIKQMGPISWQCVDGLSSHAVAKLHISHSCDALRREVWQHLFQTLLFQEKVTLTRTKLWAIIVGLIRQSTHKRPVGCDLASCHDRNWFIF